MNKLLNAFARLTIFDIALGVGLLFLAAQVAFGQSAVPIRNAGGVVMSETPQAVGNATSRIDYLVHNDGDSTSNVVCGYNPTPLSFTPGPSSGDKLKPGEGKNICTFADQIVYCKTTNGGSAVVYMDESRMVTPTPTP